MDRRVRDSVNYNRDCQQFIQNLQKFHGSRGSPFKRVPFFGGKELDLFLLYKTVTSLGGCAKVTDEKKWREVAKCFNLPASCTNAAFSLRQYYLRYLASYERLHFLGEDGDDNALDLRRSISSSFLPPSINFVPHNIPESAKRIVLGPLGEPRVHNFDRLIFSLTSGLPNEVDFALNICTLLSNVTNSIFNLAKAPTIVDLMLAHVGIFTEGKSSMRELYKEWYQESDRDFDKFWRESIDDETVKEIYNSSCGGVESDCSSNRLNLFNDRFSRLGESVEAKRVNQICVILHNFSYEELNCLFISSHSTCIRFLMLCAGSKLMSLRKLALDALDNVADKITLNIVQDEGTQNQLRILHSFMSSNDRTRKVRAISILAKLSGQQENEDVLSEAVPQDVYDELIKCLTIPDIQLILNSLDALYFLSDLGEATATAIVMVNRSIDILVCLVTVHAESYGNRAISGFRIVENKNSIYAKKQNIVQQSQNRKSALQQMQRSYAQLHPVAQQQISLHQQVRASPKPQVAATNYPPVRPDAQKQDENEEVEPEIFAARWISAFYELAPGNEIKRSQIFADYVESCKDLGRKGVLNMQSFFKILGLVIPAPYWRPSDTNDPAIVGIKKRTNPLIVKSKSVRPLVRIPDVASTHNEQTVPVRPIPVMPTISSQSQAPQRLPFNVQSSPQTTIGNPAAMFPGQMQGARAALPVHSVSSGQVPTSAVPVPVNSSVLPLKLLEEHVNSQGQSKDFPTSVTPVKPTIDVSVAKSDSSSQLRQPQTRSQVSKQPQAQVSGTSQAEAGNMVPGQPILGNLAQMQQSVLLQGNGAGIGSNDLDTNSVTSQNSLDPNTKLSSQQKLTSKERNERKKAMKAARDMINADIKASNLDPLTQCQNLTERIQKEMQQHFVQFHLHQQSIQAIQTQLQQLVLQNQQPKLPQNVMEDIHTRVRNHHAQMQTNYSKLQQLQILLQQVKVRIAQEQKGKEQTAIAQDSIPESDNQALRKTPRTPRILRKQTTSNMTPSTTSSTSDVTTITRLQQMPSASIIGIAPMPQVNAVVAPVATQLTTQMTLMPTVQSNQTGSVSNATPLFTAPSNVQGNSTVSAVPVLGANAKGEATQTTEAPTQVTFFSNTAPLQAQTSAIQLAQTAFATSGKQVGSHIIQKPVTVTYNTPILPRPPTSTLQNPIHQTVPSSAVVGQTVLFTMPVVALPQQGVHQTASSKPPQSSTQFNATSSSGLMEATVRSNPLLFSNSGTVQTESTIKSTVQVQPGRMDHVGSEASINAKPAAKTNIATNFKGTSLSGESVQVSSTSADVVTSSVIMASSLSQTSVSNGLLNTLSPMTVNGGIENMVGKGPQQFHNTDAVAYNTSNVTENIRVNGTSETASLSTLRGEKQLEKENSLEANNVDKEKGFLVNGDGLRSDINGGDEIEEKVSKSSQKRKLDENVDLELKSNDIGKVENSERVKFDEGHENDDNLIDKYGSVLGGNKRLKLNGIYISKLKGKNDDYKTEDMELGDRDEMTDLNPEPPQNGLSNDVKPCGNKSTDVIGCDDTQGSDDVDRSSPKVVKGDGEESASEVRLESNKINSIENDDQKDENCVDKQQKNDIGNDDQKDENCVDKQQRKDKGKNEKKAFNCQWTGCKGCFSCTNDLLAHMVLSHAPQEGSFKVCKVTGCKPVQRPRGSMICHFSQVHCSRSNSNDNEQVTLPQLLFPKVVDIEREDESPVTRSVRLTAALVLRNIARNSAFGRKAILNYESRLSPAAMSSSEASSAVAACLEELTKKRRQSTDIAEESDTS